MAKSVGLMDKRKNLCIFNNSLIEKLKRNQNNFKLIWFDPSTKTQADKKKKEQELQILSNSVDVYSDLEDCVEYMKSIKTEWIFLITCGAQASDILRQVSQLNQLDTVFIFCMVKERYEYLLQENSKVIGIYTEFDKLCTSIEEEFDAFHERMETFSCFDRDEQSTKDLTKESATFLWNQLFNSILSRATRTQESKEQMIQLCKDYFRRNKEEMNNIENFEKEYKPENAIYWYSKKSFLYKIVNKVLRCGSIELIHAFRYFIIDLSENLKRQHEKLLLSNEKVLTLYRGAALNTNEFNKLKNTQGIISTNGYFSTSRDESQARAYANKPTKRNDVVRVLYLIEVDVTTADKNIIFADIAELSTAPEEAEVLFNIDACFEVKSIEDGEPFKIIKMKLSNTGSKIAQDFLKSTKNEIEGRSNSLLIGSLLCDLGQYDESLAYLQELLEKSNAEDQTWIEFHIGRALDGKGNWKEAQIHFNRAYKKMMESEPQRLMEAANNLSSMGNAFYQHKQNDEALKCHQMALEIREKSNPSSHINIARNLNAIGNILTTQGKHNEALEKLEKASMIFEKFHPSDHVDLVETLNNIGITHENQKSPDKALEYFRLTTSVHGKYLPVNHEKLKQAKDAILRLTQTK